MGKELLYATGNTGKRLEVGKYLGQFGIRIVSPEEARLVVKAEEIATSLEGNAKIKARACLAQTDQYVVMTDDTGVEIDALGDEPGIHVRRWRDHQTSMTDEEIIDYCLERLRGIPPGRRGAQFRTVIALGVPGGKIELFEGILRGMILEQPAKLRIEGFPFEPLFFIPKWNVLLADVHQLPLEKRPDLLTHREKAVKAALPRIRQLTGV